MKIIHLSDLHFGTEIPGVTDILIDDIRTQAPDVIVISGDSTQRALVSQYVQMQKFIRQINQQPILIVPGNHDISLHNLIERFFYPLSKFKKYLCSTLNPHLQVDNVVILGVNSVTSYKPMSGYVTDEQLNYVNNFFAKRDKNETRIIVMHHNLIRSERHKIINDSEKIINTFAQCGINLVLSGHIHYAHIEHLKRNFLAHNMYVITAGTAISTRTLLTNSYNVIELQNGQFILTVRELKNDNFQSLPSATFTL